MDMTKPEFIVARQMNPANDNNKPFRAQTIFECIKAQHDAGVGADVIAHALIEALATCTITWGMDTEEICELYKELVKKGRGE
jgi:hypothetical protein